MPEPRPTLADAIPSEDCFTIEDLAEEFGVGPLRMRQIIDKAVKSGYTQTLIKKEGRKFLYAPQMVEQIRKAVDAGKLGKFRKKSLATVMKHAELVVNVPIFDKEIARLLKTKFKTEEEIAKFLKNKLEDSIKPFLAKRRELEAKYEKEMAELLQDSDLRL